MAKKDAAKALPGVGDVVYATLEGQPERLMNVRRVNDDGTLTVMIPDGTYHVEGIVKEGEWRTAE